MMFSWVSKKSVTGFSTIYESNITLNKQASLHFEDAYKVMLGITDDEKSIAIKPLSKTECELGHIPEDNMYKISVRASYSRITNKRFVSNLGLDFSEVSSYKFNTIWDDKEQVLIISI